MNRALERGGGGTPPTKYFLVYASLTIITGEIFHRCMSEFKVLHMYVHTHLDQEL